MGRYQLVHRLAVGGMAEVFLACERGNLALERLLVIKRILPHLAQDKGFVDMFLNEARIAARIQHPNVVQIYELGESGGFPFIAMEYVPGSTLKDLIKAARSANRPLPVSVVVELISQACAGAHAAHELRDPSGNSFGLVHRDLTPHNLMVTDSGHVKLLDFGIAKASELQDEQTRTGMLKGKISYMSPEQCRQDALDRRSDLFALGICAYELLTGVKPFQGASELATMQAIVLGDLTPIHTHRPAVPERVASVIERAMAAKPETRWQTADQFRTRLRDAARTDGVAPDPDLTARYVTELLGDRHKHQQDNVDAALERTLVTLSQVPPQDPMPREVTEDTTRTMRSTTTGVAVGALGSLVAMIALIATVGLGGSGLWYWTHRPPPPLVRPSGDPHGIVLAPTLEPAVAIANIDPVRIYLEQELQIPFEFQVADSYQDAAEKLVRREVDYALLPHGIALETLAHAPQLEILATKIMDGSSTTDGYLVVARTSPDERVKDLRGKRICYPDRDSSTGYQLPREALRDAGLDPDVDVTWVRSGSHQKVLQDLVADSCDAACTYSLNFQGAEAYGVNIGSLRILTITGRVPHDHWIAHTEVDPQLRKRMTAALVGFDPQKVMGQEGVGDTEKLTGFAPGDGLQEPPK